MKHLNINYCPYRLSCTGTAVPQAPEEEGSLRVLAARAWFELACDAPCRLRLCSGAVADALPALSRAAGGAAAIAVAAGGGRMGGDSYNLDLLHLLLGGLGRGGVTENTAKTADGADGVDTGRVWAVGTGMVPLALSRGCAAFHGPCQTGAPPPTHSLSLSLAGALTQCARVPSAAKALLNGQRVLIWAVALLTSASKARGPAAAGLVR